MTVAAPGPEAVTVVRERLAADLPGCVAGLRAVHEADGYPVVWPSDPARWLSPARLLAAWVAELPETGLAGHVTLNGGEGAGAEVSRLFVVPGARRRGVAEALVGRAVEWARERRLPLVLEVVEEGRSPAMAFYEANGWQHGHSSIADWTGPGGAPVTVRHYRLGE